MPFMFRRSFKTISGNTSIIFTIQLLLIALPFFFTAENNFAQKSNNNRNTTDVNANIFNSTAGFGKALEFSDNDFIMSPAQPDINLCGNDNFTISAWIKLNASGWNTIFFKDADNNNQFLIDLKVAPNDYINLIVGVLPGSAIQVSSYKTLELNKWHHVSCVKNGSDLLFYINGTSEGSAENIVPASILNATNSLGELQIGSEKGKYFLNGYMDELRFWNTALTESEIQNWMYREIDKTHPRYANLVLNYKFNEGAGTTVNDAAGFNNAGTLVNMEVPGDWVNSTIKTWFVDEDVPLTIELIGSDIDGSSTDGTDWSLSFQIVDPPLLGSGIINNGNNFIYTPNLNISGNDFFTYKVSDGTNWSNTNRVDLSITAVNDPPSSSNNTTSTNEDTQLIIAADDFNYNDIENDPFNKIIIISLPDSGTLFNDVNLNAIEDAGETINQFDEISKATLDNNQLKYMPYFNENGTPLTSFRFLVHDGTDYSASAYTMSINVAPVNDPPIAGSGTGLQFNGIDDYVLADNIPLVNSLPLTMEAWVKPALRPEGAAFYPNNVVSNDSPSKYGHGFGLNIWNGGSELTVEFHDGFIDVPGVYSADTWYHIAIVYTNGNLKVFVNGELKLDHNFVQGAMDANSFLNIGRHNTDVVAYGTKQYFNGIIDEVRVWNTIRTENEINTQMYYPLHGTELGLIAYWRFDETPGLTLHDATVNRNNGTLTNMTAADWVNSNAWEFRTIDEDDDLLIQIPGYDIEGGGITASGIAAPANGSVIFTPLTYSPNADYNGTDTFTYQVSDGGLTDDFKISVTIIPVNDSPELNNFEADNLLYTEGDGSKQITNTVTVEDVDDTQMDSCIVWIVSGYQNGEDVLEFVNTPNITGMWNPAAGIMTLTGTDTKANYQTALRSVCYKNLLDNPTLAIKSDDNSAKARKVAATPRGIVFAIFDTHSKSGSNGRQITLLSTNDAPFVSVNTGLTLDEGTSAIITSTHLQCSDPDKTNVFTYKLTALPSNGFIKKADSALVLNSTFTQAELNSNKITYTHNGSETITDNFKFTAVDDQNAATPETTFNITINPVNDTPILSSIETTELTFTFGDAPVIITASLNVEDADNANIVSAVVQISSNYIKDEDFLEFTNTANITGTWDAANGTLNLIGANTKTNYQIALRSIKFKSITTSPNSSVINTPKDNVPEIMSTSKTISFTINDGTNNSNTQQRSIEIIPVNKAPFLQSLEYTALDYYEGDGPRIITETITILDQEDDLITKAIIKIAGGYQRYEDKLTFSDTPNITAHYDIDRGTLLLKGEDSIDNYVVALRNVKYENISSNPHSSRSIVFMVYDEKSASNIANRFINIIDLENCPAPPSGLFYTYDKNNVILSWKDNSENESGFKVWRADFDSVTNIITSSYQLLKTLSVNETTFTDDSTDENKYYSYSLRAYNSSGMSEDVEINLLTPLSTPSNLRAEINEDGSITLHWIDNSSYENEYKITRKTKQVWNDMGTVTAGINQFTDFDIEAGITYHYKIQACNCENNSCLSNECCITTIISGLRDNNGNLPDKFSLAQNFPNPFNPSTIISYSLTEGCNVKLTIYNLLGQVVTNLVNEYQTAGYHKISFEAGASNNFKSGIYLYKIEAGNNIEIKKMIFMK